MARPSGVWWKSKHVTICVSPDSTQHVEEDIQKARKKLPYILRQKTLMDLFGAVMGVCFKGF